MTLMLSEIPPPSILLKAGTRLTFTWLLGIRFQVFVFVWLFLYPLRSLPRPKVALLLGVEEKNIITTQTMKGECWQILLKHWLERRLRFLHELTLQSWSPTCFILSLDQSGVKSFVELRPVTNFYQVLLSLFLYFETFTNLGCIFISKLMNKISHWVLLM